LLVLSVHPAGRTNRLGVKLEGWSRSRALYKNPFVRIRPTDVLLAGTEHTR
jgi:hypothetical protein